MNWVTVVQMSESPTGKTGMVISQLMDNGYSLADVLDILMGSVDGDSSALMNLWGSAEAGKAAKRYTDTGNR